MLFDLAFIWLIFLPTAEQPGISAATIADTVQASGSLAAELREQPHGRPPTRSPWEGRFGPPDEALLGPLLRSAALPGWGQHELGLGRWIAYVGVEVVGWGGLVERRSKHRRWTRAYRDLAWSEARTHLWDGPRQDGPWEYYEALLDYESSGRYDADPTNERLVPETDPDTYNGRIWQLAREIHLPGGTAEPPDPESPEFSRALEYYRSRAARPEFAWDWQGNQAARSRFSSLVDRSDDAARAATGFVGLLLLNRFVSAVDAHLAARTSEPRRVRATSRFTDLSPARRVAWELRIDLYWTPGPSTP